MQSEVFGISSITKAESHKDLGIILSSNLTWMPTTIKSLHKPIVFWDCSPIRPSPRAKNNYMYPLFDPSYRIALYLMKPHFIKDIQQLE